MAVNPGWTLKGKAVKMGTTNPPQTDFGCQVISAVLNQQHDLQTVPATACQDGTTSYRQSNPTVTLTFLQDWDTPPPGSISWFLWDNHGVKGFIQVANPSNQAGWLSACTFLRPEHSSPADTSAASTTVTLPLTGVLSGTHPV